MQWPSPAGQGERKKGDLKGARILVVEARFYDDIADTLLAGAKRALDEAGASFDRRHRARRARNSDRPRHGARRGRRENASLMTAPWRLVA